MADEEEKKKKKKKKKPKTEEEAVLDTLAAFGTDKEEKKKKKKAKSGEESALDTSAAQGTDKEKKKKKKKEKKTDDEKGNETDAAKTDAPAEGVTSPSIGGATSTAAPPANGGESRSNSQPQAPNMSEISPRPPTNMSHPEQRALQALSRMSQPRAPSQMQTPLTARGPPQQLPKVPSQTSTMPPIDRRAINVPSKNRRLSLAPSMGSQLPPILQGSTIQLGAQFGSQLLPQQQNWVADDWEPPPRRIIPPVSKDLWAKMEQLNKKLLAEPKQVTFFRDESEMDKTEEVYELPGEKKKKDKKGKKDKEKSDKDTDKDTEKEGGKKKKKDKDKTVTDTETEAEKPRKRKKKSKRIVDDSDSDEDDYITDVAPTGTDTEVENELRKRRASKDIKSAFDLMRQKTEPINEGEENPYDFDPVNVVDPRMARLVARVIDARADPTESELVDPIYPAKCECCADRNDYTRGIIRDETVVARPHYLQKTTEESVSVGTTKRDNGLGFYRSDSRILIPVSNYVEKHLGAEMMNAGYSHDEARRVEHIRSKVNQAIPPNLVEWPYYPNGPALAQQLERYVGDQYTSNTDSSLLSETLNESNLKLDDALRRLKKSFSRF